MLSSPGSQLLPRVIGVPFSGLESSLIQCSVCVCKAFSLDLLLLLELLVGVFSLQWGSHCPLALPLVGGSSEGLWVWGSEREKIISTDFPGSQIPMRMGQGSSQGYQDKQAPIPAAEGYKMQPDPCARGVPIPAGLLGFPLRGVCAQGWKFLPQETISSPPGFACSLCFPQPFPLHTSAVFPRNLPGSCSKEEAPGGPREVVAAAISRGTIQVCCSLPRLSCTSWV